MNMLKLAFLSIGLCFVACSAADIDNHDTGGCWLKEYLLIK